MNGFIFGCSFDLKAGNILFIKDVKCTPTSLFFLIFVVVVVLLFPVADSVLLTFHFLLNSFFILCTLKLLTLMNGYRGFTCSQYSMIIIQINIISVLHFCISFILLFNFFIIKFDFAILCTWNLHLG